MDSMPGEDPTLPLDFSGSVNISQLPDVAEDEQSLIATNCDLLSFADHRLLPIRARTMKDFENQITDLKKENFNLKLRIYFLEEQVKEKFDGANENIYRTNIELRVEVESLKHHLQEKHNLLIKASKAVESLTGDSGSTIQHLREDAQKEVQKVEDFLNSKIIQLEEDLKTAQTNVEAVSALLENEKILRMHLEQKMSEVPPADELKTDTASRLLEKNRITEQPNLTLQSNGDPLKEDAFDAACDHGFVDRKIKELTDILYKKDSKIEALQIELKTKSQELVVEKKNGFKRDKTIQGLTLALKTKEKEGVEDYQTILMEKETLIGELRDDCHAKEIEYRKLQAVIKRKDQELHSVHKDKAQLEKDLDEVQQLKKKDDKTLNGVENDQTISMEKESLVGELRADCHAKEKENRKLQAIIKRKDLEIQTLHQEKLQMEKDFDEVQLQKSRGDKTINDLRNQLEKLHGEMLEKGNAAEQHYNALLSETNQKLKSQEQVIKELTEDLHKKDPLLQDLRNQLEKLHGEMMEKENATAQHYNTLLSETNQKLKNQEQVIKQLTEDLRTKDPLLQEALDSSVNGEKEERIDQLLCNIQTNKHELEHLNNQLAIRKAAINERDGAIKEKDDELLQLIKELKCLKKVKEELKEKESLIYQLQDALAKRSDGLEPNMQAQYEELVFTLKSEHHIYSSFKESVEKPGGNMPAEMDRIYALRKQLEEDIQANQELRKILEEKLKMSKSRDDDTLSFCWDQTTYLSICLGEKDPLNLDIENMSLLELKKKVKELLLLVQDLQSRNYDHTNKQSNHCFENLDDDKTENAISEDMFIPFAYLNAVPKDGLLSEETEPTSSNDNDEKIFERQELDLLQNHAALIDQSANCALQLRLEETCLLDNHSDIHTSTDEGGKNIIEDLKNTIKQLRNELNHLKNEDNILTQEIGLQTSFNEIKSFSPDHQFVHRKSQVKPFDVEDNQIQPAGEGDHIPQVHTSKENHQVIEDNVPVVSKGMTNVKHKSYKKSRLPVPLKPSLNSVSQSTTTASKKKQTEQMQKSESIKGRTLFEMQKMEGEEKKNGPEMELHNGQGLTINENVILDGYNVLNHANGHPGNMSNHNTHLCLQSTDDNLSTEFNTSCNSLTSLSKQIHVEGHNVPTPQTTLQESMGMQLSLENNQNSSPLNFPNQKEVGLVPDENLHYKSELQREKAENMKLLDQVSNLQRTMGELSPSRYDSLVQSQARELSFQRQQIRDGHNMCIVYHDHLVNLIKAFEELLQASDVDYYVAEGFREQLNQSMQLLQTLEEKLCYGDEASEPEESGSVLYESVHGYEQDNSNADLPTYHLQQQMENEVLIPSSCHILSDIDNTDKIYAPSEHMEATLERDHELKLLSPQRLSQELLMEHLQEIRILRHRLEDSIKTNDRLRQQLERQIAEAELDHGATQMYSDTDQHNTLISEISFLRRENESLKDLLARGSRDKQKENEKLRESLSKKSFRVDHLHSEYERVQKENEMLQIKIQEKDDEVKHLIQEVCGSRNEINRLQSELNIQQTRLSDDRQVLESLRTELEVYEKMREEKKIENGVGRLYAVEECTKEQVKSIDLNKLLSEIQSLRIQLERSIEANDALRRKLEEQISKENDPEKKEALVKINNFFKEEWQHRIEKYDVKIDAEFPKEENHTSRKQGFGKMPKGGAPADQSAVNLHFQSATDPVANEPCSSQCLNHSSVNLSATSSNAATSSRMWADKNGCHVLGLNENYCVLRKQIAEGRKLLRKTEALVKDVRSKQHKSSISKDPDQDSLNSVSANINRAQQVLEEANRLSKLMWKVSLPMNISTNTSNREDEMKIEINRLRKTLSEHEKKLHSTMKRLHSTNQIKEDMEKIIIDQLASTHDVLRKARGNLENQPSDHEPRASRAAERKE
ncbi:CDK5 regulatory subunit-associated protein 2 isoform X2 [Lissotriton helveticus]